MNKILNNSERVETNRKRQRNGIMGHRVLVFRKSSGMTAGNIAISKRETENGQWERGLATASWATPFIEWAHPAQHRHWGLGSVLTSDFWVASIPAPGCMGDVVRWYNHIHNHIEKVPPYQFSCHTLTTFIQPEARDHGWEIRSPHTRYKNWIFADLEQKGQCVWKQYPPG